MSADSFPTVRVMVTYRGGGYVARAGRGKKAKIARSTNSMDVAARAAAAKFFGLDACNVQKPASIQLDLLANTQFSKLFQAILPEMNGGAS